MTSQPISRRDGLGAVRPAPLFVLDRPQMGENIGATARAMLNFGVSGLRLVAPRDGWPNAKAGATASGATVVIDNTEVFDTVDAALADCAYVLATTARPREILLPVLSPEEAAAELRPRIARGDRCAVLFGGERSGLDNDAVIRSDAIVSIPVNPAFSSLNLAQAAIIVAYEWAKADGRAAYASALDAAAPASGADIERFHQHLEQELDDAGFFHPPEKREIMTRNLRAVFQRAGLAESEVRTLRGVIKALSRGRGKR
ncbi:MAG: RNA methyltransferase [Pseudomonadota bacterium]